MLSMSFDHVPTGGSSPRIEHRNHHANETEQKTTRICLHSVLNRATELPQHGWARVTDWFHLPFLIPILLLRHHELPTKLPRENRQQLATAEPPENTTSPVPFRKPGLRRSGSITLSRFGFVAQRRANESIAPAPKWLPLQPVRRPDGSAGGDSGTGCRCRDGNVPACRWLCGAD